MLSLGSAPPRVEAADVAVLKYEYSELLSFARDCLETGAFCDVAFHCGGGGLGCEAAESVVRCHGLILSAVLPHFGDLSAVLRENDGGQLDVYMPDFDRETLRAWIGGIYDVLVGGGESLKVGELADHLKFDLRSRSVIVCMTKRQGCESSFLNGAKIS